MMQMSGISGCSGNFVESLQIKDDAEIIPDMCNAVSVSSLSDNQVFDAQQTSASGSSSYDGPDDGDIQIHHNWYPIKNDRAKACVTWYDGGYGKDSYNAYAVYSQSSSDFNVNNYIIFAGQWESGWNYPIGTVVQYDSSYYISIRRTDTHEPTDSYYWKAQAVPDLTGVTASVSNVAYIPRNFDYIQKISVSEGDLYTQELSYDYAGMYFAVIVSYSTYVIETGGYNHGCRSTWLPAPIDFNRLGSAPIVSYDADTSKIQISSSLSGKYLMEFHQPDYNPMGYSTKIRNEFFLTTMANTENGYQGYYNIESNRLWRWKKNKTYTVGIKYLDETNQEELYSAINDAVWELNQKMSDFGIQFEITGDETGDVTFYCGSHYDLWGYEPSWEKGWYGGTWSIFVIDGDIISAEIKLRNDGEWHQTFKGVAMEELLQSMGAGYDQVEYLDSTIHSQFLYRNKPDYITDVDEAILRILYSDDLARGMNSAEVSMAVNPTNGATIVTNGQALSFLKPNTTYNLKVYVVNSSGAFSDPASLTITTPLNTVKPDPFAWTHPKVQGGAFNLTAAEWNALTNRINELRLSQGLSSYLFSIAYPGKEFSAYMYMQARSAIQEITGCGTLIPEVFTGQIVTAYMMNILRDELNNGINNL